MDQVKFVEGSLLKILLGPFLNTLPQTDFSEHFFVLAITYLF